MPYLEDLSDEERQRQMAMGSSAPVTAAPSSVGAAPAPAPAPTSGFQNLSAYFTANQDQAQAQGEQMAKDLDKSAYDALRGDDPGKAMEVYGQLDSAATPGGLASQRSGVSGGIAGLDAYLGTRGAEPGRFQGLRDLYGAKLKNVEAPPENPGELPQLPGATNPGGSFANQTRQAENAGQAMQDYRSKLAEYVKRRDAYEAWAKRRAENIGEEYVPRTKPPPGPPGITPWI